MASWIMSNWYKKECRPFDLYDTDEFLLYGCIAKSQGGKYMMCEDDSKGSGNREVEYEQIHNFLRYLLDYRAKIFNFVVAFNGILLTIVIVHVNSDNYFGRLLLSLLGVGTSIIFMVLPIFWTIFGAK